MREIVLQETAKRKYYYFCFLIFGYFMIFHEDVWKIIKSYMFDHKKMKYRLFIKQMGEERKKEEMRWRRILFLDRIHEKYPIENYIDPFSF